MKKIFNTLLNTALLFLFLIGALVAYTALPINNGLKLFTVLSGSMEPTIKTGSLIFTQTKDSYNEGDIITRKNKNDQISITHRIIEKIENEEGLFFRTKGDANDADDTGTFPQETIIGKVFFKLPYMGYAINFAQSTKGLIILIVIPTVLVVNTEIMKIKKECINIKNKKTAKETTYSNKYNPEKKINE